MRVNISEPQRRQWPRFRIASIIVGFGEHNKKTEVLQLSSATEINLAQGQGVGIDLNII